MAAELRVQQLLDEICDSGRTPEEVCGACPELLPEVRRRWQQMRIVEAELDALFPASGPGPAAGSSAPLHASADSLRISGYEVEALLGRGGMGLVYRARHLRLNRLVALKMMLAGAYAGPSERARFQREAEAVAGLGHANIVQVYDVGEHDGCPYFTMELLEGGSLAQDLAGTPQPARPAAALLATLADAVEAAHRAGIVHRDLKPANILLTAERAPKVADFGLARHFDGEAALTLSGTRVGTPSYMAPEQVLGKAGAVGPAADVYALGAVLFEVLTGRPPFRGETAAETERQVLDDEPVPPSRLNPKVPRDLETICLKCLSKEPGRRYASAAALADDLKRFVEGRPIQARPLGWAERSWRWGRRNPTAAALVITALGLVGLASGGGVWLVHQRAERWEQAIRRDRELRDEVGTSVAQSESYRKAFHFAEARRQLLQARRRVEPAGPEELRRQVDQALSDLDLAEHLDGARIEADTLVLGKMDPNEAEALYASAFASAGLRPEGEVGEATAAVVRRSAMRQEIVAALDGWAGMTPSRTRQAWLLAVARGADPDPTRDRLRRPELWEDGARLTRLAQELRVVELSPELATALGHALRQGRGDPVALLTAAQARSPQDFWLNRELGWALHEAHRPDEALGYFRAALALRPKAGAVYNGLGAALHAMGRVDEAIGYLQEGLRLEPRNVANHVNLSYVLRTNGRLPESIALLQHALSMHPNSAHIHNEFGLALRQGNRLDEAIGHLQQALSLEPRSAVVHHNLALALRDRGRLDDAIDHFRKAISLNPKFALAHDNLGLVLRAQGHLDEAIDQFRRALQLDPGSATGQSHLGSSLYDSARAALQVAASQNPGDSRIGQPERASKRQQAMGQLRAILDLTTELQFGSQDDGWSLTTWQADPALAGVRDPAALMGLPAPERQQWQRIWEDVATQVATNPLGLGRAHASRRQWGKAAAEYARASKRGATRDGHFWFEYAALSLLSGDRPGYEKACALLIAASRDEGGPRSYHVARACTLAPDAVAEASLPGRLAREELSGSAHEFWSLTEQGALAFRAGRFRQSVPLFEQSLQADPRSGSALLNWLWLALANQRLGKAEEARRWLGKAQAWLDQFPDGIPARAEAEVGLHLHNWLEAHVLRREAEALIPSGVGEPGSP